jgi:hypothetical protein
VSDPSPLLDRAGIEDAFRRLGERLARRGVAASPEHLLAMKAFAARPRDAEDIRQLVRVLDLHRVTPVLAAGLYLLR